MMGIIIGLVQSIGLVLLVGWLGRRVRPERFAYIRTLSDGTALPLAVAIVTMIVIWFEWGSLHQVPVVHDEASYLLQAETFAHFRWTMPSPPIPAFFEQFHVLVTPTFASKYPPGHALLLVPGVWLGLPGLVPLLLSGLAAALLFILVRRVTNGWVALLTYLLWLSMSATLAFRPSYFSENTTSALWLLGWWSLLEWRETGRERWLNVLAACAGWMAITRPVTALAYALPVGIVVLRAVARTRAWRSLLQPTAIGVAIVAILPLWSAKTIGDWRHTPYSLYSKIYFPYDAPGFGLDTSPPKRTLPSDMQALNLEFEPLHAEYTPAHLPIAFYERWRTLFVDAFSGARLPLSLFALIALGFLSASAWFAVGGSLCLAICYLSSAHPPSWDLYYLEIMPLFPFLTACGIWRTWLALGRRPETGERISLCTTTAAAVVAATLLSGILIAADSRDVMRMRPGQDARHSFQATFAAKVARLAGPRTIVFIRYAPTHQPNFSLIANASDLANARTWLVYDRGAENAELIARAPDRVPYLFDQATYTFTRLTAPSHE